MRSFTRSSGGPQFLLSSVPDPYTTCVDVNQASPSLVDPRTGSLWDESRWTGASVPAIRGAAGNRRRNLRGGGDPSKGGGRGGPKMGLTRRIGRLIFGVLLLIGVIGTGTLGVSGRATAATRRTVAPQVAHEAGSSSVGVSSPIAGLSSPQS
jgi:hypothetical protein